MYPWKGTRRPTKLQFFPIFFALASICLALEIEYAQERDPWTEVGSRPGNPPRGKGGASWLGLQRACENPKAKTRLQGGLWSNGQLLQKLVHHTGSPR